MAPLKPLLRTLYSRPRFSLIFPRRLLVRHLRELPLQDADLNSIRCYRRSFPC